MKRVKHLGDLGALKSELQRRTQAAAHERAEAQRRQREQRLFAAAVGEVHPLKNAQRAAVDRARPEPQARQRALDEEAALRAALSDEIDVDSLLETDEALSFRRAHIGPDVLRRLRRGHWAIQAQLDLHGFTRDEAREQLAGFVRESVRRGWRCVRVVHGKGHGSPGRTPVLKAKVRAWLVQSAEVLAFAQARPVDGGAGALVVLLKD